MEGDEGLGLEHRMRLPWLVLCLLWLLVGCGGAARVIRLDTGRGSPVVHVPRAEGGIAPIRLDDDEVKEAVAGERFGKVMGRNAALAFVMLATAAIGSMGATLGAKLQGLPRQD